VDEIVVEAKINSTFHHLACLQEIAFVVEITPSELIAVVEAEIGFEVGAWAVVMEIVPVVIGVGIGTLAEIKVTEDSLKEEFVLILKLLSQ